MEPWGREAWGRSRGKRGDMRGSLERDPKGKREGRGLGGRKKDLNMKRDPNEGKEINFMGRGFLHPCLMNLSLFIATI